MIIRPENFEPLGILGNIFRFAFFHTKQDTNYPILIIDTHDQIKAIEELKRYIVEWGINKTWDLDTVELGLVGIIDAFVVDPHKDKEHTFKAKVEDSLYTAHAYIFRLKKKSVVSYCDMPF